MSSFLAHLHAELRRARLLKRGATHNPQDAAVGLHKEYTRMERISLPTPDPLDYTLQAALSGRHSTTNTEVGTPLTLKDFGTLLGSALRRHPEGVRRTYPSGGGLYPVETYIIATQTEGMAPGIFHYHPTAHALERLWALPHDFDMKRLMLKSGSLNPSTLIVFTSVWERSSLKYGNLAYLHALIEVGHMGENILLMATALGLETRPYAGFNDELVTRILDLNEDSEQAIYSITLSKLSRSQSKHSEQTLSEE